MLQYVTTSDPKLEAFDLPPYPQLPANYDARKIEEIRRTLVVLDVLPQWKMDDVMEHFTRLSGQVKYARLAETPSSRCFLLEFSEQKSIAGAMRLQGTEYNHGILNIYHSSVAIIKPEAKSNEAAQREIEEAMNIVKEAQSMLNAAMQQNCGSALVPDNNSHNDKDKNSSSRRHSRSRSHSRRRSISRSRSKRSRSRKRSRSKHRSSRRSRSRSKKRSRSRSKRSSPSRKRSRSRKRSKSRSKRSKSISRRDDRSKRASRSPSSRSKERRKRSGSVHKRRHSHSRSPAATSSSRRRTSRSKSRDRKHRSKSPRDKHRRHHKDDKHRRSSRSKSKDRHRDKEAKESKRGTSRSSKRKSPTAAESKKLPTVPEEKIVPRDYDEEEKIGAGLVDDPPKAIRSPKGGDGTVDAAFKPPEPVEQRSATASPEKSDHMDISNSP